jgi:hypothetical protein
VRFAVASLLLDYDFEICTDSDPTTVKTLEQKIMNPEGRKLYLRFTSRIGREDSDLQGHSIINI